MRPKAASSPPDPEHRPSRSDAAEGREPSSSPPNDAHGGLPMRLRAASSRREGRGSPFSRFPGPRVVSPVRQPAFPREERAKRVILAPRAGQVDETRSKKKASPMSGTPYPPTA